MSKEVSCPYCGLETDICHDDGYGYEEDRVHQQECSCGKTFAYTTSISFYHDAFKAPCMNGEEHDWQDVHGYPVGYQSNRKRCSICGKDEFKDCNLKYDDKKDIWLPTMSAKG